MAWKLLPTDFTDAVWEGLKRYTQVDNEDGNVRFYSLISALSIVITPHAVV